jgi:hypothetical protein
MLLYCHRLVFISSSNGNVFIIAIDLYLWLLFILVSIYSFYVFNIIKAICFNTFVIYINLSGCTCIFMGVWWCKIDRCNCSNYCTLLWLLYYVYSVYINLSGCTCIFMGVWWCKIGRCNCSNYCTLLWLLYYVYSVDTYFK